METMAAFFVFLVLVYQVSAVPIAPEEASLLVRIRRDMGPREDSLLSTWKTNNTDCDTWVGVACNPSGRVIELYLAGDSTLYPNGTLRTGSFDLFTLDGNYSFSGQLSPLLGSLTSLESLTVASGRFNGSIPASLGNLTNLKALNLSGNVLTGPIPQGLNSLKSLEVLDLHSNRDVTETSVTALNGSLPDFIGTFTSLQRLDLSQNDFQGIVPLSFRNLLSLTYLSLSDNRLSGDLSFMPAGTNLTVLDLGINTFTGELNPSMAACTSLHSINVYGNSLGGPLPSWIGSLLELREIYLDSNFFTSLPAEIASLAKLQVLSASHNYLTGVIPLEIFSLTNLRWLDLSLNQLAVQQGIPDQVGNLKKLQFLRMDSMELGGRIPPSLGSLSSLTSLSCISCGLVGPIPPEMERMTSLQLIYLSGNNLNGTIPDFICNMKNITALDLSDNSLVGEIPDCIAELTGLNSLGLSENALAGKIPSGISSLNLGILTLDNNFLTGNVPVLPLTLSYLSVDNNFLTGTLPSHLGDLVQLFHLSLSFNQFFGTLPPQIGNLVGLNELNLRSCNLQGSIPHELTALTLLTSLDLSGNALSGPLHPNFFLNFTQLTYLSMKGSLLSGRLPSLQPLTSLMNLDLSLNRFTYGLPSLPPAIVSLNLTGNRLKATLSASSFSHLHSLLILQLDGNEISGSVPALARSAVLSLSNTNVTGPIPGVYLEGNSTTLLLHNTPICEQLVYAGQSFCVEPLVDTAYLPAPFCTPLPLPCLSQNQPSPFLYHSSANCTCSGYIQAAMPILHSPYSQFTSTIAQRLQHLLADLIGLHDSQVLVSSAVPLVDGSLNVTVQFFGTTEEMPLFRDILNFAEKWYNYDASMQYVSVFDNFGYFRAPEWTFVEYVPPPVPPPPGSPQSQGLGKLDTWIVGIIAPVVVISTIFILSLLMCLWMHFHQPSEFHKRIGGHQTKVISLQDIKAATNNFSEENVVGKGGQGVVYLGVAPNGDRWAVKRPVSHPSKSTLKEYQMEVDTLCRLSHSNVVKLLGFCDEKEEQILVYEFMDKGNLKAWLQDGGNNDSVKDRVAFALGVAEGLKYLHKNAPSGTTVTHRDIKSENILLNESLTAKISDFGLIRDNVAVGQVNGQVYGTPGYIDPESHNTNKITDKSDVYSFGIVLLELITGQEALVKGRFSEDGRLTTVTLHFWVQPYLRNLGGENGISSVKEMLDDRLGENYNLEAIVKFAELARDCTGQYGEYRPSMDDVCQRLSEVMKMIRGEDRVCESSLSASIPPTSTSSFEIMDTHGYVNHSGPKPR